MPIVPYTALGREAVSIKPELMSAFEGVLENGRYILGPEVSAFEREFAAYCQSRAAVGVATGTEIAILDDAWRPLPVGEVGEVSVRGAGVVDGYRSNPEANAASFRDGWFRTGDSGALDAEGFTDVAILAYAAKYASALYGPFREAVDVTIAGGGDRKGYQQDWHNAREALREIDADVAEGADITMELNDAFYGERRYEAEDPEGNRWHFGEPLDAVRRRRGDRDS